MAITQPTYPIATSGLVTHVGAYTDSAAAAAASPRVVVAPGGNVGAALTLDMNNDRNVWLVGTLNANATVTVTNRVAGMTARLLLTQDATGSRSLTVSDGTNSVGVPIPTTPSSSTAVDLYSPDGTTIYVDVAGGASGGGGSTAGSAGRKLDLWKPAGAIAESGFGRLADSANQGALTSGTLRLSGGAVLPAGQVVTNITFWSGTTAAGTPTNQWFCLVRLSDLSVLAKTQDDTTTAWAGSSAKTLSLAAGSGGSGVYTPASEEAVYIGCVVAATTVPSLVCWRSGVTSMGALAPQVGGNSTGTLTNPASLGATAAALSASNAINHPYAYLT